MIKPGVQEMKRAIKVERFCFPPRCRRCRRAQEFFLSASHPRRKNSKKNLSRGRHQRRRPGSLGRHQVLHGACWNCRWAALRVGAGKEHFSVFFNRRPTIDFILRGKKKTSPSLLRALTRPFATNKKKQVCETSANVVDVKIGTGFVSNVKVILSTPNATIGGLEFVVTEGKKSTSTFCGRALGLSAWIGKPGQAVGAIGGTCTAPVGASRRLRRRRGRSILGAAEEVEAAGDAPSATSTAPAAAPPATSTAPAAAPASNTAPAGPLLLPPLPPPPHHNHHERQQEQQQQPPPLRKHHHLREDNKEGAAAVPAPAAVTDLAPPQAALPSISRRRLAQAPNNGTTTGGLSASTLQVVLVPAPQGENNSGAYGNGTIFGG